MSHAYYWDDDRKPLPRATRCLEDELVPDVKPATDRAYVKAPKTRQGVLRGDSDAKRARRSTEAENRKKKLERAEARVAAVARGEPVPFVARACLWCSHTTRRADQCCGSRACEAAAEAEFTERRLRRMGKTNDR